MTCVDHKGEVSSHHYHPVDMERLRRVVAYRQLLSCHLAGRPSWPHLDSVLAGLDQRCAGGKKPRSNTSSSQHKLAWQPGATKEACCPPVSPV